MKKLCAFPTDPIKIYYKKGEIKPGYYNPSNYFGEVHLITFAKDDIESRAVRTIAGDAKLFIHPLGKINPLAIFILIPRLLKLLKEIGPHAIRAYDPSVRGCLAVYCGKRLSIPTVVSIHSEYDEDRRCRKNPILVFRKVVEKYVLTNADKIICVTNYVANYARRYEAKNITVIHNRVYGNKFANNRTIDNNSQITILSVGRLNRYKRADYLIKAIKDIDAKLCLVGDGEMYGRLVKLAKRLNLRDKVEFVGAVPYNRIHEYYNSADIFAMATAYEGFCTPVLEAMYSALPIVASDIPAIREIVEDAGVLVGNKPDLFRDVFIRLIKDKQLKKELSMKSHKRALCFAGEKLEQKEVGVYRDILDKG